MSAKSFDSFSQMLISYIAQIIWNGRYISTSMGLMAANLDRDVASDEKMLFTNSHNLFVMLTHQVICQRKDIIPAIPRDLWSPNLTGWWLMVRSHKLQSCLSDKVVTWGHATNKKRFISTFVRLLVTKLDRVIAFEKGLPHWSHDTIATWNIYF